MDWKERLHMDLQKDEGLRLKAYRCTSGVLTIGYGHTGRVKPGDVITKDEADTLLRSDIAVAIADARVVCKCFDSLSPPRKAVLANMAFNLGQERLSLFQRTLAAVCAGQYKQAALHMKDSLWSRQVGQRATRLAQQMSTGKWQ